MEETRQHQVTQFLSKVRLGAGEIAALMRINKRTVERDPTAARLFLNRQLSNAAHA